MKQNFGWSKLNGPYRKFHTYTSCKKNEKRRANRNEGEEKFRGKKHDDAATIVDLSSIINDNEMLNGKTTFPFSNARKST
jgi:hypothetical protein